MRYVGWLKPRAIVVAIFATWVTGGAAHAEPNLHWYRGNTHTHSVNSDGDSSPDVVARWYKEHGYQFLFITDHEYLTDVAPLNAIYGASERFLLLPGQEVTQWGADPNRSAAHVNALFTTKIVWPLGSRTCIGSGCGATADVSVPLAQTIDINIASILAEGGIAQVNHPNYRWSVRPADLAGIPNRALLEIWNGQGGINNLGGDDGSGDVRPSAEGYWDWVLSKGKIVWGVGSDDAHVFTEPGVRDAKGAAPGQAWIMVHAAELTPTAIRSAIERGEFYASNGVSLDEVNAGKDSLSLVIHESRPGVTRYVTRFLGQGGKLLAEVAGTHSSYHFAGTETYVRADVIDSNGMRAWTQPTFLDGRTERSR